MEASASAATTNTISQSSRSAMSSSLGPGGLQHARPPVHHQLPEVPQTHVHRVGHDATVSLYKYTTADHGLEPQEVSTDKSF